jgi:hypothetical protein
VLDATLGNFNLTLETFNLTLETFNLKLASFEEDAKPDAFLPHALRTITSPSAALRQRTSRRRRRSVRGMSQALQSMCCSGFGRVWLPDAIDRSSRPRCATGAGNGSGAGWLLPGEAPGV